MKRRLLSILLAAAMVLSMAALSPLASAEGGPTLTVGSVADAAPGATITVPVTIANNPGFAGLDATLTYDSEALTLTALTSAIGSDGFTNPNAAFMQVAAMENYTQDITLFNATFTVNEGAAAGDYTVGLAVETFCNAALADITDYNVTPGTVTVVAPAVSGTNHAIYTDESGNEILNVTYTNADSSDAVITVVGSFQWSSVNDKALLVSLPQGSEIVSIVFPYGDEKGAELNKPHNIFYYMNDGDRVKNTIPAEEKYLANDQFVNYPNTASNYLQSDIEGPLTLTGTIPTENVKGLIFRDFVNSACATCVFLQIDATGETPPSPPTPAVTVGSVEEAAPGATITVPVTIANNPGYAGYTAILSYDLNKLWPTAVSAGTLKSYNKITFEADENIEGDGTLVEITFNVNVTAAAGDYAIGLTFDEFYNANDDEIEATVTAGTVTVAGEPGAPFVVTVDGTGYEITQDTTAQNRTWVAAVPEGTTSINVVPNFDCFGVMSDDFDNDGFAIVPVLPGGGGSYISEGSAYDGETDTYTVRLSDYTMANGEIKIPFYWNFNGSDFYSNLKIEFVAVTLTADVTVGSVEEAAPGATITVPVTIADNPGYAGYTAILSYDLNKLWPTAVSAGTLKSYNKITFEADENIEGDGTLVEITFNVNVTAAAGDYAIGLTFDEFYNENDDEIEATVTSGTVTVAEEPIVPFVVTVDGTGYEITRDTEAQYQTWVAEIPAGTTHIKVTPLFDDFGAIGEKYGDDGPAIIPKEAFGELIVTHPGNAYDEDTDTYTIQLDDFTIDDETIIPFFYVFHGSDFYSNLKIEFVAVTLTADVTVGSVEEAAPGATITVPVTIAENPGYAGYTAVLDYNADVFELTGASKGTFDNANKTVSFEADADVTGDGTLVELTFAVSANAAAGEYEIGLAFDEFYNADEEDIEAEVTPGTVTVVVPPHTHTYGEPTWSWADDYSSATATFVCTAEDDTQTVTDNAPVETVVTEASCTEDKVVKYTATVTFNGTEYTNTTDNVTIPNTATGHTYGEPEWTWTETDNGYSAIAKFTCTAEDDTQEVEATVRSSTTEEASCTEAGKTVYTAAVSFNNENYTKEKEVEIPALGHDWGEWVTTLEPTATKPGEKTRTCSRCQETETQPIPATGGGGGGGGPAAPTSYAISLPETENGTVTAQPEKATAGEKVTLTATPNEGYELDKITVTDADGRVMELTENEDGTYSFKMPAGAVTVSAEFKSAEAAGERFKDVKPGDWFYDAVNYVADKELMNGVGDDMFDPDGATTRGMIVTILYRLEGEPKSAAENPFTDVEDGEWYTDAVIWAAENGIVKGYGDGTFGPKKEITREQFAAILYRYVQYKGGGFTGMWAFELEFEDAGDISDWADEAMHWCVMNEIITGRTETTLVPGGNATRAEAATILMRFCESMAE